LTDFRPQWHHIFPRKFLEGKVPDESIDSLANIAVIGPEINIRISAKDPMDYVTRYEISDAKLAGHLIDADIRMTPVTRYQDWLRSRAERLADAGNAYLSELQAG
jgi:hypothetical protein